MTTAPGTNLWVGISQVIARGGDGTPNQREGVDKDRLVVLVVAAQLVLPQHEPPCLPLLLGILK